MTDLESRFYLAGNLVVDICAGTLSTGEEYLQLPELYRFVGCYWNSAYFQDAPLSQLEAYKKQISNPNISIALSEEQLKRENYL